MARVRLYLDEHVQASLAQGLRARGVDALTTQEAGNSSLDDEGQLRFAAAQGRVLLSYNKRHFAVTLTTLPFALYLSRIPFNACNV